jgi:predicted  nucleic acid-binding Zn-ribbon protein
LKANISGHETKIRVLKEREGVLVAELATARAEVTDARTPLTEPVLRLYDRIAVRQMPVCVPLRGGKCGGCHLKVSSDVESGARGKGDVTSALPTCDQCGRIVWWESAL